jgi:hypothetical protein
MAQAIRISEPGSGLDVMAALEVGRAPGSAEFLTSWLGLPREVPAIHAIWTGPEISCPIPSPQVPERWRGAPPPVENGTMLPAAGDVVLAHVPPRLWGGAEDELFDLGLFYAPGGRLLLPIGWVTASLVARVPASAHEAMGIACGSIRRSGACVLRFELVEVAHA